MPGRPAQSVAAETPGTQQHRAAHWRVKDERRMAVTLPAAIALSSQLRKVPGMGCAFDQGDRMQQDLVRAGKADMLAGILHALRGPLPSVLPVKMPVQNHWRHAGPNAGRPRPSLGVKISWGTFVGIKLDLAFDPFPR